MFRSILDTFVAKTTGDKTDPEAEVLNLELLAYNFHESLDLGPLFKHVQRQLQARSKDAGEEPKDRSLLWRLERVAEEVKERQLAAIRLDIVIPDVDQSGVHSGTSGCPGVCEASAKRDELLGLYRRIVEWRRAGAAAPPAR
jgi:hypothetical protein